MTASTFRLEPATDLLIVVDVQYDFLPGGALAVPEGDAVLPVVNRLLQRFTHAVATQDWHPADHASFASQHPGRQPFETLVLGGREQVLWPDHCVQGTRGAALHDMLDQQRLELILRKGFRREIDSYSGFRENDRTTPTGLAAYLRERGVQRVFIAGLARGFCTDFTAEDAAAAGFAVFLVEDGCRGITPEATAAGTRRLIECGVTLISSTVI